MYELKRQAMFDRGAQAVAARYGQALRRAGIGEPVYVCPLCVRAFLRSALDASPPILSLAHVPPQVAGGRELCLTCRPCNNLASPLNKAAGDRAHVERALGGDPSRFLRGRVTAGEHQAGASVVFGPDEAVILLEPSVTDPQQYMRIGGLVRAQARGGEESPGFTLTFGGYNIHRARLSGLRDAYLIAFAALGYSYILRPELEPVRQQIREPSGQHLPHFHLPDQPDDAGRRRLMLVEQPLSALLVYDGSDTYWLPPLDGSGEAAWEWVATREPPFRCTFEGTELEWPTRMNLLLDIGPPTRPSSPEAGK